MSLLSKIIFLLGLCFCLTPYSSPPAALTLGIILALLLTNPFQRICQRSSKILLQLSVVLLGFGMDLPLVLEAGLRGAVFAVATIVTTLALGNFLGRRLKVSPNVSLLISSGTAICGGSAIAAVGTAIDAEESEMTIAIGAVFLLNAAALYLFPMIGHALELSQYQFGTWAGVAIHDVSSVVGASSRYGVEALQIATAVKLSRALWIVPLVFGTVWQLKRTQNLSKDAAPKKSPPLPYFIGFFLLASVARSFIPAVTEIAPLLTQIAKIGFTVTLFLIGSGISRKTLAAVGWRALLQGVLLWLFISVSSLVVVMFQA